MADRSLVLDANILIRAVLGKRVGQLIEQYVGDVDLFAPDTAFVEAEEHLPQLCTKRGLPLDKGPRHAHASNAGTRTIGR